MLNNLKQRWGVNGIQLVLIICTFAIGGSLCGFTGKKLMMLTGMDKGFFWMLVYVMLATLLWPFCVLLVSVPLGQFSFFIKYLTKIGSRITGRKQRRIPVAIFASGSGSNAEKIMQQATRNFSVALIVCNESGAGVLEKALKHNIETLMIEKERFSNGDGYVTDLQSRGIQFIVLAGFLWKVPISIIRAYPGCIINIHPALLPKYGGKGMYGARVHQAVIAAGDKQSGITIHYVDELYDHGNIIFQATCNITETDDADTLAEKIRLLEHKHYPEVIEGLLQMQNSR